MNDCIIGIGSNINPEHNIKESLKLLALEVQIIATSSWTQTTPIGITNQDDFINGAVKVRTPMSMDTLTQHLKVLENKLGRNRTLPKFGPRIIDLDIVVWNNTIIDNDYHTRGFVKNAVNELWQKSNTYKS